MWVKWGGRMAALFSFKWNTKFPLMGTNFVLLLSSLKYGADRF